MKREVIVAALLLLACAGSATAGTLVTGSHLIGDATTNGNTLICVVTNAGKKTLDVTIEWVGMDGSVLNQAQATLGPSGSTRTGAGFAGEDLIHCRFSFKGGSKKVRAAAHLVDPTVGNVVAIDTAR